MKTLLITLILSTTAMATDLVSKVDSIVAMNDLTSFEMFSEVVEVASSDCSTETLIESDLSGIYKRKANRINAIHSVVVNVSKELDIDACIVMAMIAQESSFNESSKSVVGAKGLMQVMPSTKKYVVKTLGQKLNTLISLNLESGLSSQEISSIIVGSTYFKSLVVKFKGNQDIAVIAYNEGPTKIQRMINKGISFGTKHNHLIKVKANLALLASN